MKRALSIIPAVLALLLLGERVGLVGFHYPHVVENEPLHDPVGIAQVEGKRLKLEDGRVIEVEDVFVDGGPEDFFVTGKRIDVEEDGADEVRIYSNKRGWICGTPWAKPIRIPIFPDDVPRNRRQMIAFGSLVEEKAAR